MRQLFALALLSSCFLSCYQLDKKLPLQKTTKNSVDCSDSGCNGTYEGPEFVSGSDIAHQFSNTMSGVVGDKLKELYSKGIYSRVDFTKIQMSTKGMGSGHVIYKLAIPIVSVKDKCGAYTSFDHVGGWNHAPALSQRKAQLANALMKRDSLHISSLKTTPEGLQEYWIQWRNKKTQASCE
ncbi:hypothetical protein N9954_04645 [Maribacter sp.]|nr:hypothetical protein [Maribacter sp.]